MSTEFSAALMFVNSIARIYMLSRSLNNPPMRIEEIYRERLKMLVSEIGSQTKLADKIGKSPAQVSQWISASKDSKTGKPRAMSRDTARHIEAACGKPDGWMDQPIPAHHGQENATEAQALRAPVLVPVVGHVKGGDDGYLEEMQFPVGSGEGYVEYWTRSQGAYALRIKGDSMHPRYRAGEFVVVTPLVEALPGQDVVVRLVNGKKLLKQLNWVRDGELQLLSINNHYGPLTLPLDDVESIHRVAGSVPHDAFIEP